MYQIWLAYDDYKVPKIGRFWKVVRNEKKKEEESKSSLGTFQSPITSVKIGILASGFFLRDRPSRGNK